MSSYIVENANSPDTHVHTKRILIIYFASKFFYESKYQTIIFRYAHFVPNKKVQYHVEHIETTLIPQCTCSSKSVSLLS